MIRVTPGITLPLRELSFHFARAGGPGGQNVNKVSSAVQLRFNVETSPSLPPSVRARILRIAAGKINRDGTLIITARRHRTQEQNRREALNRLVEIIRRAARPVPVRRKTVPPRAAGEKRLTRKYRASEKKRLRRPVLPGDD